MINSSFPVGFIAVVCVLLPYCTPAQTLKVHTLTTEYANNPVGLETTTPRLSWQTDSRSQDGSQSAYQILVASSPARLNETDADVWNSGKQISNLSVNVMYRGAPLESRRRYYWKVRIWDNKNNRSDFSAAAYWEMGLLAQHDWKAKWISARPAGDTGTVMPAPHFRKKFQCDKTIASARLYIAGAGYYEAYLNGSRVGDHVLDPVFTRYDRRTTYVVHDITNMLRPGDNLIGIIAGNGWFNQHSRTAWNFDQAPWRSAPAVIAQIEVMYTDGTSAQVASDGSWQWRTGPIIYNDIHNGEHYDARLELTDWMTPEISDTGWKDAHVVIIKGRLTAQLMPPIRVVGELKPKTKDSRRKEVIYDFGQNISGWVKISVRGPAGAEVVIRHGERIHADGTLDIKELSRFIFTGEVQTDRYTLKGGTTEVWHPRFTYHGFQYAEVTCSSPEVVVEAVTAQVVHTNFETRGTFSSSDTLLNRIHENLKWSYLTNYHGYPTDCPHREKMGWTGDAHLVCLAGLFNFDGTTAYLKWLDDFVDEQRADGQIPGIIPSSGWGYTNSSKGRDRERGWGPQWEGAFQLIAWDLFQQTGDTSIIRRYYAPMKAYVEYLSRHAENNLTAFGIDDHKQLRNNTRGDVLSAGYYFHLTSLLAQMAAVAGNTSDGKIYQERAEQIRDAFNKKYFDPARNLYGTGGQTQLSEALYFGLTLPEKRALVLDNLLKAISERDGHVETGVVGTKFMIHVLMRESDRTLYDMVTKTDYPGWGHWIKSGATTLFQNWDATQSRNHIMFGTVGDYFYQGLAGINTDPLRPGYKNIRIRPLFDNDVRHVESSFQSPYGRVSVNWVRERNGISLAANIPFNSTATIILPATTFDIVTQNGRKLRKRNVLHRVSQGDVVEIHIGSGRYTFGIERKQR